MCWMQETLIRRALEPHGVVLTTRRKLWIDNLATIWEGLWDHEDYITFMAKYHVLDRS